MGHRTLKTAWWLAAGALSVAAPVLAAAASQVTPEPQGTSRVGQAATPPAPQPPGPVVAGQALVRIGDAGNLVRLVGAQTDTILTITGLGSLVDQKTSAQLLALASTLTIGETVSLGTPASPKVRIVRGQFLGRPAAGSLAWIVTVSAEGLSPNALEKRLTTLMIGPAGDGLFPLEFMVTNQPSTSAAQYDVTTPGYDWMVSRSDASKDRVFPLMIVNRSERISGLRLSQVSLKRLDDGGSIGFGEVALLSDPKAPAADAGAPTIDLLPNETKTVFLRLDAPNRLLSFGSFSGQVQLVTNGSAPKAVPMTVRVTSDSIKVAGAVLVILGLATSLFVTSQLQPRLARLQALRPATLLRDRLVAFSVESTQLSAVDFKDLVLEAERQAARLETSALDAQGLLPLAISIVGTTGAIAQLQGLLSDISERLAALIVLRDTVAGLVRKHPGAQRAAPVSSAIGSLNAAASRVANVVAANAAVASILNTLTSQGVASEALRAVPARVTTQQLDFMLQETAGVAALIWAVVSFAIGVTYIYSDVDFGTPADLLGVFVWGLGLTTFGAGVQQLTPRQVATQIGVMLPRSATADVTRG